MGTGSTWAFHSGQICTAPTRVLAQRGVYDQVVAGLAQFAGALKVGDPLEDDTVVGPLISEAHRGRVEEYIASGVSEGAEVVAGASAPSTWTPAGTCRRRSWPAAPATCGRSRRRSSAR